MPTSFWSSIPKICSVFEYAQPIESVLDIGIGRGKYGMLAREYINDPPVKRVDGVEVFTPYIGKMQRAIYDKIYNLDIATDYQKIPKDYDLVLMIDVIEHLTPDAAYAVLDYFKGSKVIVSTPVVFFYEEHPENRFEEHISHWHLHDFQAYSPKDISTPDALIVVLNE